MGWLEKIVSSTLLIFFVLIIGQSIAQESNQPILDKEKWQETVNGQKFIEKAAKRKPQKQSDGIDLDSLSGLKDIFTFILYALLIFIIGFILYKLVYQGTANKKIDTKVSSINLDDIEGHIDEVDFDKLLKEALADENFKLAIRIYFLIALKNLSLSKRITWSNEKTNQEYLNEMLEDKEFNSFRHLIRVFEIAWYSDHSISQDFFNSYSPDYIQFINRTAYKK